MRRVDNRLDSTQEKPRKFQGFHYGALAVLAREDQRYLVGGRLVDHSAEDRVVVRLLVLAQHVLQQPLLPRVKMKARDRRQLYGCRSYAALLDWEMEQPWGLHSEQWRVRPGF